MVLTKNHLARPGRIGPKGKKSYGDSAIHHFKSRRFEEGVGAKRKSGSGRPSVQLPPKLANKMIKEILSKVGVSQAKMGRKYGVHRKKT